MDRRRYRIASDVLDMTANMLQFGGRTEAFMADGRATITAADTLKRTNRNASVGFGLRKFDPGAHAEKNWKLFE